MPNIVRDEFLVEQVDLLYQQTGVAKPSAKNCITPLSELIGSFNLSLVELPKLNGTTITRFLEKRQISVNDVLAEVKEEPLAGLLYTTHHYGLIFVEQNDLVFRRRYSAAHELGHYWLHILPKMETWATALELQPISFVDSVKEKHDDDLEPDFAATEPEISKLTVDKTLELPPPEQMEVEAERFAANLLMPKEVVEALVAKFSSGFQGRDLVQRLAAEMLVSRSAMYYRLHSLGLWQSSKTIKEQADGVGLS